MHFTFSHTQETADVNYVIVIYHQYLCGTEIGIENCEIFIEIVTAPT